MSMKSRWNRSLSTAGVGLAALVVSVTALGGQASAEMVEGIEIDDSVVASADADAITARIPCITSTGVKTCFDKDGDKVYVKDTKANGKSAVGLWATNYGRTGGCRNKLGEDKWAVCNYNMREEGHIQLENAQYDGETRKLSRFEPRALSVWLPI
ncbi:hypothetical protein [Streptomyces huiliensis]|uniref:hypothetical protein n=1 Tax=Streptomyces huiliensis TaxID=2876027 RepID=UPI001CC01208|nr:hypothetical protein [Streptomyces huiliensis]MBZ4321060.1 hypothetical protein [Streptomyces huiliensis]